MTHVITILTMTLVACYYNTHCDSRNGAGVVKCRDVARIFSRALMSRFYPLHSKAKITFREMKRKASIREIFSLNRPSIHNHEGNWPPTRQRKSHHCRYMRARLLLLSEYNVDDRKPDGL